MTGTFESFPAGINLITNQIGYTPQISGPHGVGNYGVLATGNRTHSVIGAPYKSFVFQTEAPPTTGMVTVTGTAYGTVIALTGSHSFNTTQLTGMISTVRPFLNSIFTRNEGSGNFVGGRGIFAAIDVVRITFLPEPGVLALIAAGSLGLVGLAVTRRR